MTLKNSFTQTTTQVIVNAEDHQVTYAGAPIERSSSFGGKIFNHLDFLMRELKAKTFLQVETKNSFPSSCGIASSASGMAALTLAAAACWKEAPDFNSLEKSGVNRSNLSNWARIGSGSASRSLWGGFVCWRTAEVESFSYSEQVFSAKHWQLSNVIVLVDPAAKSCSSSEGHQLAMTSPLFRWRHYQLPEKLDRMQSAIAGRNLQELGSLVEEEAFSMHAVMQSSNPPARYFNDATVAVIDWLTNQRRENHVEAYFTLDAGANLHLLCAQDETKNLTRRLSEAYPQYELLVDETGTGPSLRIEE